MDLVVDESPLLEEAVHAHDGADVAGQVAAARRARQVLRRVQPVRVDHEVSEQLHYKLYNLECYNTKVMILNIKEHKGLGYEDASMERFVRQWL